MKFENMINQIIEGDCFSILKTLPDKSIDAVVTDPPYEIGAKGCGLAGNREYLKQISADKLDCGFNIDEFLNEAIRVLRKISIVVFCSRKQIKEIISYADDNGVNWRLICWHKSNPTPLTNNNYLPDTEYIFHLWESGNLNGTYKTKKTYFLQPVEKNKFSHPTVKPINIIKDLIINCSNENDLILDPFMGGGTTGIACLELRRKFIGIEKELKYVEMAKKRIKNYQDQLRLI